jgi:hypothetical protein
MKALIDVSVVIEADNELFHSQLESIVRIDETLSIPPSLAKALALRQ